MDPYVICVGCGFPLFDFSPCVRCTCAQCGNDARDGFCPLCFPNNGYSNDYIPNPISFDNPLDNFYHPPHPTYETYSCESCGNDSHYGYDCPPRFSFTYEQESGYTQNYNEPCFPQYSPSYVPQYPCCDSCGGPHETFQCQPTHYSGFDQVQPPQRIYSQAELDEREQFMREVIRQKLEECKRRHEFLEKRQKAIDSIDIFLGKYQHYSFQETPKVLIQAQERLRSVQNAKPEEVQGLFVKLYEDIENLKAELPEYIPRNWESLPYDYDDDDDDDDDDVSELTSHEPTLSTIDNDSQFPPSFTPSTPILDSPTVEPENSFTMGDDDSSTNPSVDNLVPIPSEFEGIPDVSCDIVTHESSPPLDIDHSDDDSSSDDTSYDDVDYVEASPFEADLESFDEVEDFLPENGEIAEMELNDTLSKVYLLISKIEALNVTPSTEEKLKTPSNLIPDMDNDQIDTSPELESFSFNMEEKDSGSTTIHSDISLPDLNHFHFEPDPGELTSIVNSGTLMNTLPTTNVNLPLEDDEFPLFAFVVWTFLPFLQYLVTFPCLLSIGSEDKIFDPGIVDS